MATEYEVTCQRGGRSYRVGYAGGKSAADLLQLVAAAGGRLRADIAETIRDNGGPFALDVNGRFGRYAARGDLPELAAVDVRRGSVADPWGRNPFIEIGGWQVGFSGWTKRDLARARIVRELVGRPAYWWRSIYA